MSCSAGWPRPSERPTLGPHEHSRRDERIERRPDELACLRVRTVLALGSLHEVVDVGKADRPCCGVMHGLDGVPQRQSQRAEPDRVGPDEQDGSVPSAYAVRDRGAHVPQPFGRVPP